MHIDGHTDFRHPGNSEECASVAGEDLAAAVGMHWSAIADIDGQGPYFDARRVVHIGHRDDDEEAAEARGILGRLISARDLREQTAENAASATAEIVGAGYWLQVDVDVLDPDIMPAVDSPDADGVSASELIELLARLAPGAVGASITVFDPDLDPDGRYATLLAEIIATGLARLGAAYPSAIS